MNCNVRTDEARRTCSLPSVSDSPHICFSKFVYLPIL
ncbi:unnamed protein product [Brassica oleracea var. botrytis]